MGPGLKLALAMLLLAGFARAQEFRLGEKVADFELQDLEGKTIPFSSMRGPLTVVLFVATQCPVSNAYNRRMIALYNDYAAKQVAFVFVNANRTEPAAEVRRHAQRAGFPFPVYKDANNLAADRFGAEVTPETYVIDRGGVMRYHGAIDDSQNEARVRTRGLRLALDALLAGQAVEIPQIKVFGCTIKRARKSS